MDLLETIKKEKNIDFLKDIGDLHLYENKNDLNYKDIIGFHYINSNLSNWKEIESKFICEVEKILVKSENEYIIEPYLIFFIKKENYFEELEEIVKIEKDEFYCRKFVYQISNKENIVSKLPFGSPVELKIKRDNFLSAEKTLLGIGVDKNKTKNLLKKTLSEKEKDGVIDYFKSFKEKNTNVNLIIQNREIKNSVRLKKLVVKGFRIYKKEEIFDLDADLIVLYGSNGLGKTSFFDAFEYGVTGEIKRFLDKEDKNNIKLIKNFGLKDDEVSKINLEFEVSSGKKVDSFEIERNLGEIKPTFIKGSRIKKEQTKSLINKITQKNIDLKKDEIIKLFRATHINNQSDSELTENVVKGSSTISNEILSRMISFEDYIIVENNLNKLINRNKKDENLINSELDKLTKEVSTLYEKYEIQDNILSDKENSMVVSDLKKELKVELEENNLVKKEENLGKDFIENELIIRVENRLNEIKDKLQIITKAEKLTVEFEEGKKNYNKIEAEKINEKVDSLKGVLQKLDKEKKQLKLEKNKLKMGLKEKNELLVEGDRYIQFNIKSNAIATVLEDLNSNKENIQLEINNLKENSGCLKEHILKKMNSNLDLDKQIYSIRENTKEIENVYKNYDKYINNKIDVKNIIDRICSYNKELEENIKIKETLNYEILNFDNKINIIKLEIENELNKNSEFENLLFSIKKFIKDNVCPICATEHNTQSDILNKIDFKISSISQGQKIKKKKLAELEYENENKTKKLIEIKGNISSLQNDISLLMQEKEELNNKIEKFEVIIKRLNLINKKEEIKNILDIEYEKEASSLKIFRSNSLKREMDEKKLEEMNNLLIKKNKELEIIQNDILFQNNLITSYNKNIIGLENFQILSHIDFSNKNEKFSFVKKIEKEKELLSNTIENIEKEILIYEEEKEKCLNNLMELNKVVKQNKNIEEILKQIKSKLLLLPIEEHDLKNINKIKQKEEINLEIINSLKSKVFRLLKLTEFEVLSLEQKQLKSQLDLKESQIIELKKEIKELKDIEENIDKVKSVLKSAQHNIMDNYCKKIEPMVSIIQSRLRSLYGFTDLNLSLDKENDEVKIKNSHYDLVEKDDLKPCKYLSEAQKNIIRLSLFLSTTLSQNWSGFKTIFLDDPIQHFDDLNTYAFLELLKSLILTTDENEKKQIIISTCDNKFFNLIKEKFSGLKKNGRVKYYNFESINKEGPIIKKL